MNKEKPKTLGMGEKVNLTSKELQRLSEQKDILGLLRFAQNSQSIKADDLAQEAETLAQKLIEESSSDKFVSIVDDTDESISDGWLLDETPLNVTGVTMRTVYKIIDGKPEIRKILEADIVPDSHNTY